MALGISRINDNLTNASFFIVFEKYHDKLVHVNIPLTQLSEIFS